MSNETALSVLIKADDQASKKLHDVTKNIERNVEKIKDVGGKAKASTEFVGTLASSLGGSEIGAYAGQLAGLTEKISAFSEVSKAGGAGALVFKAGIVGATAAISFGVGKAIGDVVFQTEKWNETLEKSLEKSKELDAQMRATLSEGFTNQTIDIELIRDPEQKQEAYKALLEETKKNLIGVEGQVKKSQKAVDEWNDAWQITGERKGQAKIAQDQLDQDKERLKLLQDQLKQLTAITGREAEREQVRKENASADFLDSIRSELALTKAVGDERLKIIASKTAVDKDIAEAVRLMKEIEETNKANEATKKGEETEKALRNELELLKAQGIEAERIKFAQQGLTGDALERVTALKQEIIEHEKLRKAEEERVKLAEKVRDAQQSELDRIRETVLARVKGEEEVHVERMKKLGIEESQARKIASLSARANKQQDDSDMPVLQAFESRTLLRATGGGWQSQFLEEQRKTRETNEAMLLELERLREDANKKNDDKTLVKLVAK